MTRVGTSSVLSLPGARGRLHGREPEIRVLETAWQQAAAGCPQLVVVEGHKRVGKTFLLTQAAKGKRALIFGTTQQSDPVELGRLVQCVQRQLGGEAAAALGGVTSWDDALQRLVRLAESAPLLLVLDELPQFARSVPDLPQSIRRVWEALPPRSHLMLVLTGSARSAMDALVGAGSALGRWVTLHLPVEPLDVATARAILPRLRPEEFLEAYAACGGYALHLQRWDQDATTEENLLELAGTPGGVLLEDASTMLREAVPDVVGYQRIMTAVGSGKTRYSQIITAVDQRIERPIEVLVRGHLLRRGVPVGGQETARVTDYEIADPYLSFWFSVLAPALPEIEAGEGAAALRAAQPRWQRHLSAVFKDCARLHARYLVNRGTLPGDLVVGRWWSTDRERLAVDVLGLQGQRTYLVGAARWEQRRLDVADVLELRLLSHRVPQPVTNPVFALWARGGVTDDVARAGVQGFDLAAVVGG